MKPTIASAFKRIAQRQLANHGDDLAERIRRGTRFEAPVARYNEQTGELAGWTSGPQVDPLIHELLALMEPDTLLEYLGSSVYWAVLPGRQLVAYPVIERTSGERFAEAIAKANKRRKSLCEAAERIDDAADGPDHSASSAKPVVPIDDSIWCNPQPTEEAIWRDAARRISDGRFPSRQILEIGPRRDWIMVRSDRPIPRTVQWPAVAIRLARQWEIAVRVTSVRFLPPASPYRPLKPPLR